MKNDEQKKASEKLNEKEDGPLQQEEQEQLEGGVSEQKELESNDSGLCNSTCVACSPGSAV